jgi:hypothetical protein
MPWYRTSRVYVNNVNITNTRVNIVQVNNVYNVYNSRTPNVTRVTYVNQRVNAVTAVSRDTFVNARPVGRSFVQVDEKQLATAPVNYRPDAQPVRASTLGAGAPARFRPPAAVVNRQVVATRTPAITRTASVNVRTEAATTPRYEAERPSQPQAQPMDNQRGGQYPNNVPRPGNGTGPRPALPNQQGETTNRALVRSAPPVQDRPETQRSEQQKFDKWQQARPAKPSPPPKESHPAPPPKEEHHK